MVLAVTLLCVTGYSQTNTQTISGLGQQVADTLFGPGMTNLEFAGGATKNVNNNKWGEFAVLTRNIPIGGGMAVGIGAGVDHYDNKFYSLSGQLSLKSDITPFASLGTNNSFYSFLSKQVVTPFGFVGIGTPFGGNAQSTSSPETVEAAGLSYSVVSAKWIQLKVLGMYGTRQGIGDASGAFYGGGLAAIFKF